MIRHTVLFRLRRPVTDEAREAFLEALRGFIATAEHTASPPRLSVDLGLREGNPRAGDALLEVEFETPQDLYAYLEQDTHVALLPEVLEPACEGWWSVQTGL